MMAKLLYLESFYGGSHRDFADNLIAHSGHDFSLHMLPARFWKWRMRGASLHFYQEIQAPEKYDAVFATDLMSVSDLKALWGKRCPPVILYFHENQLSYPVPEGEKMDFQFGFTDITSALTADALVFNSQFHLKSFLAGIPGFIRNMPEFKPLWIAEALKTKCTVLYPGCHVPEETDIDSLRQGLRKVPVIVWNHRWEFDKNPEAFFEALYKLKKREVDFKVAVLGENFQLQPKVFLEAKEKLHDRICHFGYVEGKTEYFRLLANADIVVSTSIQENFGISITEAVIAGCFPVLPNRLSYPELLSSVHHSLCLYDNDKDLEEMLYKVLKDKRYVKAPEITVDFEKYRWKNLIKKYDTFISDFLSKPS